MRCVSGVRCVLSAPRPLHAADLQQVRGAAPCHVCRPAHAARDGRHGPLALRCVCTVRKLRCHHARATRQPTVRCHTVGSGSFRYSFLLFSSFLSSFFSFSLYPLRFNMLLPHPISYFHTVRGCATTACVTRVAATNSRATTVPSVAR